MRDTDSQPDRAVPATAAVFARIERAWSDLRAETGAVPRRRDLDLARLGEALPHAFLMSRVAPGVARLRVAGRAVTGLLGMDPRGMPLSVFFSGVARGPLAAHVASLFDGPCLVDLALRNPGPLGLSRRAGRLLLLPLLDDEGEASHAVGVLALAGRSRPARVALDIAGPMRCETVAKPLRERPSRPPPRRRDDAPGSGAPPPRIAPPRPGLAEAPHPFIRLVVDND